MPISAELAFASALTLTIQFLIFTYLYSSHRVRFFQYLLTAWGLMSVAKGLHLARSVVSGDEWLGALINAVFFGATLLILAAGLAFRYDYRIQKRDVLLGSLGMLIAASLGDMSDASATARGSAALATGGALLLASLQFWPSGAHSPRYRGSRFLAMSLALWGVQRMVSPLIDPQPGTGGYLTMHMAFMFVYFLSTFAVIIMVLDRARSETAALKEFNERLVDGLGEGLQLVDGNFRIQHANRWMHEQFGELLDRRCYEVVGVDGQPCQHCPLERRREMTDAERLEVSGAG